MATSEQGIMRLGVGKAIRGRRMRSHYVDTEPAIGTACFDYRQSSDSICTPVINQLLIYLVHEPPSSFQMEPSLALGSG